MLESYGLQVLRFTNDEVLKSLDGVCEKIEEVLRNSPQPPSKRGAITSSQQQPLKEGGKHKPSQGVQNFLSPTQGILFSSSGPYAKEIPQNEENIVLRAVHLFFKGNPPPLQIHLVKNIPVGSGLGGGSSNTAGTLRILQKLFPKKHTEEELSTFAKEIGSDVSFFWKGHKRAEIKGTGEKIYPLSPLSKRFFLLLSPQDFSVSSAWAYKQYDLWKESSSQEEGQKIYQNDFLPVLLKHFPFLQNLTQELQNVPQSTWGLSGSGSFFFLIFSEEKNRDKWQKVFLQKDYEVCPTSSFSF